MTLQATINKHSVGVGVVVVVGGGGGGGGVVVIFCCTNVYVNQV